MEIYDQIFILIITSLRQLDASIYTHVKTAYMILYCRPNNHVKPAGTSQFRSFMSGLVALFTGVSLQKVAAFLGRLCNIKIR